jgi:hypothetical protein
MRKRKRIFKMILSVIGIDFLTTAVVAVIHLILYKIFGLGFSRFLIVNIALYAWLPIIVAIVCVTRWDKAGKFDK